MKIHKSLLILAAFAITTTQASAITVNEASSQQYLINHGYSKETARLVELQKKQVNGEPVYDTKPMKVRWLRKIHSYLDPAIDDGQFGSTDIRHDSYSKPENL